MRGRKKAAGIPLRGLIAFGLTRKQAATVKPANRLANAFLEVFQKRGVKDPLAAAHAALPRAERRALGDRGGQYGLGEMASSIQTRNAR